MGNHSGIRRAAALAVAASGLWLASGGSAAAQSGAPEVMVVVLAERYVFSGRAFDDLDALEGAVESARPKVVRLYACGEGTERAQRAAAHRFGAQYLELRVLDDASPICRSAAGPRMVAASQGFGPKPSGIDDTTVDRWWHQQMP